MSEISKRYKKFVEAYLTNGRKAKEAAVAAGYKAHSASVFACNLLKKTAIRDYIAKVDRAIDRTLVENLVINRETIADKAQKAYNLAAALGQSAGMVSALMLQAKLYKLITDKTENETTIKSVPTLSHVDLEERISNQRNEVQKKRHEKQKEESILADLLA